MLGECEAQGALVGGDDVVLEGLDAADGHFPEELRGGVGVGRRDVNGRVIEGKVPVELELVILESLKAKGDLSLGKGAHQQEPVLGIHPEDLLDSVVDVLRPRLEPIFTGLDCQKNVVDLSDSLEEGFELLDCSVVDCQALSVAEARSVYEADVEAVVDIVDVVRCDI